ncbi:esterase-like activity of phytase family protein [Halocynthiibacter namhaensis]|uniref:esterase-like activity of phytase family protein n=1 Tax=Halocynthiibacter namhaensis TaxID=1290553 RepID=UPI0005795F26|nr:esterase-like activity of phytase family protein [Halocynthiibacter namhaensis]
MSAHLTCLTSVLALSAAIAVPAAAEMNFNRVASFATPANMALGEDRTRETSPEIIAATDDGMTLVYTDSPLGVLGMIDITDPHAPKPLGNIELGGEPTSVALFDRHAFVGVNTSESYTAPSGHLAIINLDTKAEVARCDIGGQPDSVAVQKDGSLLSIAIENERDEDLGDGELPQMPAGSLVQFDVKDALVDCDAMRVVDLTGLAQIGGSDPEPEFVGINGKGETVVTLQENNHLAIIDRDGNVASHFSAGSVDLEQVNASRDGRLTFDATLENVLREPDAVKWLDDDHFITANEGDMNGGSRGWTVFNTSGEVVYESGISFENAVAQIGHYPEKRAGKKGVEPESVETGTFEGTPMAFIGAERASVVGVYDMTDVANPQLQQLLPSGIAPEGIVAIPGRNLLVTANEKDFIEDRGVRAHVMIYEYTEAPAAYPQLTSAGMDEIVGWGALSGLVADANDAGIMYAVNDSFYKFQPTIFTIDANQTPARITNALPVTRAGYPAQKLDMEGIALDGNGGFWIASEGRTDRTIPHAIYHVGSDGEIDREIGLPDALMSVERRFGFEGITQIGDTLWMAVQREWRDDPENHVKLVAYNLETEEWGAVLYEKADPARGWTGLSEITAHGDYVYVIERDNQIGSNAAVKNIYRIPMSDMQPVALGGDLPVVQKELVRDLMPDLQSLNGYVQDKVEGLAIDVTGTAYIVTDNDGVDDHSGETLFLNLGNISH